MFEQEKENSDDDREPTHTPESTETTDTVTKNIPNYMTEESRGAGSILEEDVCDEMGESGCGGDSDMEADDADVVLLGHNRPTTLEEAVDDTNEVVLDDDNQLVYVGKGAIRDNEGNILKIASVPDDWVTPLPNKERNEVAFEEVDNPGDWDSFCYRRRYKSGQ